MPSPGPLWRLFREGALALAGAALVLGLFFAPALSGERVLYSGDFSGSDLLELNVPRRALAAEAVRQGRLPHWTPLLGNGHPLLAEGQSGVFYPTTLPLFLALPLAAATNWSLLTTLAVALLGGYTLARVHGARPAAAAVAALAWGLGAVMVLRLKHLNLVQVIAWLPLGLACTEGVLRRGWELGALLLAGVWALQALAGHPHAAYLCLVGTGLYALARLAAGEVPRPARSLALLAAAGGLALLLAAVQLVPTAELVGLSLRGRPFTWEAATAYPFRPADLVRFVHPFAGGNPADGTLPVERLAETGVFWESHPYLGLVPLALALAAPWLRRDRKTAALAGAALLCLLLALGRSGGVYGLAWKLLPGFDLFRFPSRFLIPFAALAALLAGLGAEALLTRLGGRRALPVSGVLLLLTALDLYHLNASYQGYLPAGWFEPPPTVAMLGPDAGRVATPTADQTWQRVCQMAGGWRGDGSLLVAHRDTLAPDASALWGVAQHADRVVREGGIELLPYAALQKATWSRMAPAGEAMALTPEAVRLLELQDVTHLLSFFPLVGEGLQVVALHRAHPRLPGPLYVYRTSHPVPRVRLVGRALAAGPGPDETLALLASPAFDPSTSTVLEGQPAEGAASSGRARLVADEATRLEIEADSTSGGFVVLEDNWHPAWRATVDGIPAPILRADLAFRAVRVGPGPHRVVFAWESRAFAWGVGLSLAGGLAWLALLAGVAWRGRKAGGPDEPAPPSPEPAGSPPPRKGRKKS